MKKLLFLAAALLAVYLYFGDRLVSDQGGVRAAAASEAGTLSPDAVFADAYANRKSNLQVLGEGTVTRLLPDDNEGSRHQKFIIALASGQTLLVAHNIDAAPRVAGLRAGDRVEFAGEYEWNGKGGVVHWTHRTASGAHPAGWLRHGGRTYQ